MRPHYLFDEQVSLRLWRQLKLRRRRRSRSKQNAVAVPQYDEIHRRGQWQFARFRQQACQESRTGLEVDDGDRIRGKASECASCRMYACAAVEKAAT